MDEKTAADYWDEGHASTDEHGPGLCECLNPYRLRRPCPEPGCIKSVEHPGERHADGDGHRWPPRTVQPNRSE